MYPKNPTSFMRKFFTSHDKDQVMATEFRFLVEDRPGSLHKIASLLGEANVNIEGISGIATDGQGVIHIVTNDPKGAKAAFEKGGLPFTTKEVLLLNLKNTPGQLSQLTKAFSDRGINMTEIYMAGELHQIIDTDNYEEAKLLAKELGLLSK